MSREKKDRGSAKRLPEDAIKERRKRLLGLDEIRLFLQRAAILALFLFVLFGVFFGIHPVDNNDMMPRISAGDVIVYYRLANAPVAREIVIYKTVDKERVGRVIGRPGDIIEITDDSELLVNGFVSYEEYIFYDTPDYDGRVSYPVRLGENEYFLLADYRIGARDSRYYGPVSGDQIKGKAVAVMRWMNL